MRVGCARGMCTWYVQVRRTRGMYTWDVILGWARGMYHRVAEPHIPNPTLCILAPTPNAKPSTLQPKSSMSLLWPERTAGADGADAMEEDVVEIDDEEEEQDGGWGNVKEIHYVYDDERCSLTVLNNPLDPETQKRSVTRTGPFSVKRVSVNKPSRFAAFRFDPTMISCTES
jgi:hypothetical protein